MMTADGDMPAELGKLQKGYELLGELSRDDRVTVYLARDRLSGNEVAIKVLRAANARGREALAHYASDARLLTALEHPNIVTVHSVKWLSEDVVAVVTERVRGPSLRQVLDVAGTLPVARATEVLRGLGRALAWAHSTQIMHRDVRPENVIFEDGTGRVVLSDFGLARRIEGTASFAAPGADAYRAPELSDGRYPDRRSDVYSLGIVGWELLTGRRPWPDTMEPIEPGQRAPAPPPLAEIRPGLPPALVAAIEGAVQLDRDRRIADVATFMERLTKVAPPAPEPDEEPADEASASFEPTAWVALPVPRMPKKPAPVEREASAPVVDDGEAPVAAAGEREMPASARDEGEVSAEAGREDRPAPDERFAPPAVRESAPAAADGASAATGPSTPAMPVVPPMSAIPASPRAELAPPAIPQDSEQRPTQRTRTSRDYMPKKPGASRDDAPTATTSAKPESAPAKPALVPERPAELERAAALPSEPDAARPTPEDAQRPSREPLTAAPPKEVPSEMELPPPEPVRFADVPSEPLRGPISGPLGAATPSPALFGLGPMRGGLGTPRHRKTRSRGRGASDALPPPPPLQPMWDTPAEFPLPVMPDPRPVPADAGIGATAVARRRWTRRGIGIAAAALLLIAAAVTLARMERPPNTTAGLIEPETPTGYGGDVVLPSRGTDTAVARERRVGGGGVRASDDARVPDSARASEEVATPDTTRAPRDTATPAGLRPSGAAASPPRRASPPGRQPAASTPAREPAPPATKQPPESPPTASQPAASRPVPASGRTAAAVRTPPAEAPTAVAPPRTAERSAPPSSPCTSPALADQRACLAALLEPSDADLNEVYGDVISAMRRRANTAPGDPDPPEVQRLRASQRAWSANRDAECRRRGRGREGPLWATERAQCLREFSVRRSRELSATMSRLRRD